MSKKPKKQNAGEVDVGDLREQNSELVEHLRGQIKTLERNIVEYRGEHGVLESFFMELGNQVPRIAPAPRIYRPTPKKVSVTSPCSVVMCNNDGHYGSIQPSSEIEGFGVFNPKICKKRKLHYCQSVIEWTELHRRSYHLDELVLLDLGDSISGDIHDELRITNAFPSPVQCVGAGELLAEQISMLAPHYKTVRIEFIVEDNHSRLTKKPQCKEAGYNSFNYIVAHIAKNMLKSHKNVEFNIYPQYEAVVNVQGRRYLICHGHGVQGWAGFPWYGVERKLGREALRRMNASDIRKFHKIVGGHWHTPIATSYYWFSGSCSGTDAYDHKNGRYSTPSQAAWIVHPRKGEFDRTDFDLDME